MDYIYAFLIGGAICALVQLLMEKTKLMPGRIMVLLVCSGAILNARIKNLASSIDNARFLDPSGYEPLIRDDIFAQDKIHFNKLGYDIYAEFFKEALFEELKNF